MRKEKWLLDEIEKWQTEEIISPESAEILKTRYAPKKKINLLIVLFSIIGTLFVGMGGVLVGAHNLWYKLPIAARTAIGFLPLVASQVLVLYVYLKKRDSIAFCEGAAILNMAGVFSSVAIVGQIFHLPSDFTNYILLCGVLALPSMLILNAIAPLGIYFWTVLNGGLCFDSLWETPLSTALYVVGALFAIYNFRAENGRAVYAAWISVISGFILVWVTSLLEDFDVFISLFAYFALLGSASVLWERAGRSLEISGTAGTLIVMLFATYEGWWLSSIKSDITIAVLTLAFLALAIGILIKKQRMVPAALAAFAALLLRAIWALVGLNSEPFSVVFMIVANVILLAVGVYYIWAGARKVSLLYANVGMITVCTLIIMRFFDSEMSLGIRGVVFILLGIGFLGFNSYLVRMRKKAKEEK